MKVDMLEMSYSRMVLMPPVTAGAASPLVKFPSKLLLDILLARKLSLG